MGSHLPWTAKWYFIRHPIFLGRRVYRVECYADWAAHMSSVFEVVDIQDAEFVDIIGKAMCCVCARYEGEANRRSHETANGASRDSEGGEDH